MRSGESNAARKDGPCSTTVECHGAPSHCPGPGDTEQTKVRLQALYREHSAALVRRLRRETGSHETALELAHETFVRLLRMAPARFLQIEQPEAFLHRVSTNLRRDWGRSRAVADQSQLQLGAFAEDTVDPIAVLEARDTLRRLELAMGKLKPKTRAIFLAHRLDGLTYAEIAERTGLSVKGVEKQMSKAIAKIDRFLERS